MTLDSWTLDFRGMTLDVGLLDFGLSTWLGYRQREMSAIVSALEPAPSNPKQVVVYVDDAARARLYEWQLPELGLEPGTAFTGRTAERIDEAERFARALEATGRELDRRSLSRHELLQKLERLGHDASAAAAAADRAEAIGLLDEEALARALIREEREKKGAAPPRWRQKLARRGVDPARIDRLVAEAAPSATEARGEAEELLRRWRGQMAELAPAKRRRRLGNRLARRGYEAETIRDALEAVEGEAGEEEPAE